MPNRSLSYQPLYGYAAGERIANWPLIQQIDPASTALEQGGTYDFQRDNATNTYFDEYVPAANYAIGVYMAGAGYSLALTYAIAQGVRHAKFVQLVQILEQGETLD
jgi:hypothetical protein